MNKLDYYNQCEQCGRVWPKAQPNPCRYWDGCVTEHPYKQAACIRNKQPDCESTAVIPSITVDTADGITNLANCFVHVATINTTFYVDDKHRVMVTWAGPVELDEYDVTANTLGLRSQTLYTTINDVYTEVYFDKQGVGHVMRTEV